MFHFKKKVRDNGINKEKMKVLKQDQDKRDIQKENTHLNNHLKKRTNFVLPRKLGLEPEELKEVEECR